MLIKTAWEENYVMTNPLLEKLAKSDIMERLKFIDQYKSSL